MNCQLFRHARFLMCVLGGFVGLQSAVAFAAWEPTKPVEFIVPAGPGGGADLMARFLQGVVAKNNLMKQPFIVVNKSGGAGAEGFLDVKGAKGDPHKVIITLSNLFTTPLATGVPFNWKDLTPVAMLALDEFVLWVNTETPYKTAQDYIGAIKSGKDGQFRMGGTGSKQEDQIITVAIQGRRRRRGPTGRQARRLHGKQSERGGGALARRRAAPSVRVRQQAHAIPEQGHDDAIVAGYPDVQVAGIGHPVPDASRHLHAAGRNAGAGRLLRHPLSESARASRVAEVHRGSGVQQHVHVGQAVRRLGSGRREHASHPDARSRFHREIDR